MNDDTISRAKAIKALGEAHFKNYGDAIMVIQAQPSATDTNVPTTDTISRQAAIDALTEDKEMINAGLDSLTLDYNTRKNEEQRREQIDEDIETIKALPSAQPEHLHIVMEKLNKQYEKAINNPFVIKPMAWALYQVWKEYDR